VIFSQGSPPSPDCRGSSSAASLGRTRVAQPSIVWNSACGISPATFTQSRRPDAATRVRVWIGGFETLGAKRFRSGRLEVDAGMEDQLTALTRAGRATSVECSCPPSPAGRKQAPMSAPHRRPDRLGQPTDQDGRQPDDHHDQPQQRHRRFSTASSQRDGRAMLGLGWLM
jgi:hypothetical protein